MQSLRRAHRLARFLLVWFALSVGVAFALPVLKVQAAEVHCGDVAAHAGHDHEGAPAAGHLHDCVMCALTGEPPVHILFIAAAPPQAAPEAVLTVACAAAPAVFVFARGPPLI